MEMRWQGSKIKTWFCNLIFCTEKQTEPTTVDSMLEGQTEIIEPLLLFLKSKQISKEMALKTRLNSFLDNGNWYLKIKSEKLNKLPSLSNSWFTNITPLLNQFSRNKDFLLCRILQLFQIGLYKKNCVAKNYAW